MGEVLWDLPKVLPTAAHRTPSPDLVKRQAALRAVLMEEPDGGNLLVRIW